MSNSNWDAEKHGSEAICRLARPHEIEAAVAMILAAGGKVPLHSQVREFVGFAAQRNIDLKSMWVAEADGRLVWATLPMTSPGRTLLLFAPPFTFGGYRAAATQLVNRACDFYASRDIHLAQVLIDPVDADSRAFYASLHFRDIAELIYLQVHAHKGAKAPDLPPGGGWLNYSMETHALFAEAILQTYRDSLDCPALGGLRNIEDILAGHKATGEFDPKLWLLLRQGDRNLGVLLLSPIPPGDGMELVYVGLPPDARGRGLGDIMIRQALHCAASANRRRLTLAVDGINTPALRLYYGHGLQRVGQRFAMIRDLRIHDPLPVAPRA